MSRTFTPALITLGLFVAGLVAPLWNGSRDARTRIPPSEALIQAYMGTLCRPPDDLETLRWDSRPFENQELLPALEMSPEGRRVHEVRRIYIEVLHRDPVDGDCRALRRWVESRAAGMDIRRTIADSSEARRVTQVRQAFLDAFGRDPDGWDNSSLRRWVDSGLTRADIRSRLSRQRPLIGVHYFTWYEGKDGAWGNDANVIGSDAQKPILGWYQSGDPVAIDTHLTQMAGAGFDLVIVHFNPESPEAWPNVRAFFARLGGYKLRAALILDGLYTKPATLKAAWAAKVAAEFTGHPNYFFLHGKPLLMLYSATVDFAAPGLALRNVYWTENYRPGANSFNHTRVLYPRDWAFWAPTPQPIVNGVVPVIPGYVDTHLGRPQSMEYPRDGGRLYHEQWKRALELRPEFIFVYSWNEYFEQTSIEPTQAWGTQYLQWTACYIAHAHRGTTGRC